MAGKLDPNEVFSPNAPVDEKALFAGRTAQVRAVLAAINQKGQHAILFGERGVGKTSLANVIAQFLGRPRILTPRINCATTDIFEGIWTRVMEEIWMQDVVQGTGFHDLKKEYGYNATELLGSSVNPDSVRRALTIIANNALPIVIIDEFDRLDTAAKRAIADTIKSLSDHAVQATVLLVGVADSVDQLIDQHHSVERALVQVHMPRMSSEEIRQIILTGLDRLELKIDSRALIKIDTLARGLPHYAHLLGLHAAEEARDQELDTITMSIVHDGIRSAIAGSQQTIKNSWHQATTSPRKDNLFADVLLACALARPDELGFFAPQDIRDALRVILDRPIEIANFAQHLSDFCESKKGAVLERRGEKRKFRFRFINPLLQTFVVMQGFALGKVDDEKLAQLTSPSTRDSHFAEIYAGAIPTKHDT